MTETLHLSLSTARQRSVATLLVMLIVLAAVVSIPYAEVVLPVVHPFLPMFAATVALTEALTAYLLLGQFLATRRFYLVPLSGAYAYVAVMVSIQVLVFPGVFAPTGLLGGNSQSAVWLWVFWHGGFPFLVCLAILLRDTSRHSAIDRRVSARQGVLLFLLAPLLALGASYIALRVPSLPPLIHGNDFKRLSTSSAGWTVWGLNLAAVALVLRPKKSPEIVSLFLFVAVLAALADVSLTLLSTARYSLGWYVSRLLSIVSSMSLLIALIFQISRLYLELSVAHASLVRTSARDNLTGVYNRNSFDTTAQAEWLRAQRSGEPLSLILVDVDYFKRYNDHLGHVQGDACLRMVAQALGKSVKRPADFVARYGGEEFAIVLPGTRTEQALRIAEKVRLAVAALALPAHAPGQVVSISAGCASWAGPDSAHRSLKDLVNAADQALYQAKSQGRNRVCACLETPVQVSAPSTDFSAPKMPVAIVLPAQPAIK